MWCSLEKTLNFDTGFFWRILVLFSGAKYIYMLFHGERQILHWWKVCSLNGANLLIFHIGVLRERKHRKQFFHRGGSTKSTGGSTSIPLGSWNFQIPKMAISSTDLNGTGRFHLTICRSFFGRIYAARSFSMGSYGITFVGLAWPWARSLSQAVRFWDDGNSKCRNFSNKTASQWREKQTSTEVSKIQVFLQRVEQKNNQITQNQKKYRDKKTTIYTFKKKHVLYVATTCGTFCSAVYNTWCQWVVDLEKAIGNLKAPKVEDGKEMENGGHLVYGKMGLLRVPQNGSKSQLVERRERTRFSNG